MAAEPLQAQQMVFCFGISSVLDLNQIIIAADRNTGKLCISRSLTKIFHCNLARWFHSCERWWSGSE